MKKQTIGFDRELKLAWLDLTAGLAAEGLDLEQIRPELQSQLAADIPGREACRKTVTLLTRLWVRVPADQRPLQSEALTLLPQVLPEERLWLHWGMSMLAYPFFYDVAATAGRLLKLQGQFEPTQVRQRMREQWGQRTTLDRAIQRLLRTFAAWDVIQLTQTDNRVYQSVPLRHTHNEALALWFLDCLAHSVRQANGQDAQQILLTQLIQSPAVFPFELAPFAALLRRSNRFEISRQGLDLEMVTLG